MQQQGSIKGLAYREVYGYDENGDFVDFVKTRVKRNDGTWVTNHDAHVQLKAKGAVKIRGRNIWVFEPTED